jgi:hypothetical protein
VDDEFDGPVPSLIHRKDARYWSPNLMDTFAERLKSTFETLVRPLTPEDGQSETSTSKAEARLGLRLPAVLREYYLLAGRFDRFDRAHNQLRRPEEWSIDGGKLAFLEENQCVVYWGVEVGTSPDDPPVYQGQNGQGLTIEWYLEHDGAGQELSSNFEREVGVTRLRLDPSVFFRSLF